MFVWVTFHFKLHITDPIIFRFVTFEINIIFSTRGHLVMIQINKVELAIAFPFIISEKGKFAHKRGQAAPAASVVEGFRRPWFLEMFSKDVDIQACKELKNSKFIFVQGDGSDDICTKKTKCVCSNSGWQPTKKFVLCPM